MSAHYLRAHLFSDFVELHGDRQGADDPAIVGGIGLFAGQPVTVITTSRGHKLEERLAKHFGQAEPAGYRKAARLVKDAARFKRPVLLFIDTAGAFPGKEAEYAGQGQAIAQCLTDIGQAQTPIISVIFGEGGSGGALALACGDELWMMENSMYSVLSPEGFASILWKDASRAAEAARAFGLDAGIPAQGAGDRRRDQARRQQVCPVPGNCPGLGRRISKIAKAAGQQSA